MANIQERRDKDGKLISFSIRVYRGRNSMGEQLKPATLTFPVEQGWSEKTAKQKAVAAAAVFEKQIKDGVATDTRLRFDAYAEYVVNMREQRGELKPLTAQRYRELLQRINPILGHVRLKDIRPDMLNSLYDELSKSGVNKRGGALSPKTVLEHHRVISTILEQAVREMLIPYNAASRATPPKVRRKEVAYFEPEQLDEIVAALADEPIRWRTLVTLLIVTGARRGEVLGLHWQDIDFANNVVHIRNSILYSPELGVFESTPKTPSSVRDISIPESMTDMLKEYRTWQLSEINRLQGYCQNTNFYLFTQDNGKPMHPDSVTDWLKKFSKRKNLPHINPHAFRHSSGSYLLYKGADITSVSRRLGHAQKSTTMNFYAHAIEKADKHNADLLGDIISKKA